MKKAIKIIGISTLIFFLISICSAGVMILLGMALSALIKLCGSDTVGFMIYALIVSVIFSTAFYFILFKNDSEEEVKENDYGHDTD